MHSDTSRRLLEGVNLPFSKIILAYRRYKEVSSEGGEFLNAKTTYTIRRTERNGCVKQSRRHERHERDDKAPFEYSTRAETQKKCCLKKRKVLFVHLFKIWFPSF